MRDYLCKEGAVRIHKHFVVSNPFQTDRAIALGSTLKKLIDQLHRFRSVFNISDNPNVKPHLIYSGAITAKGTLSRTQRDDICMALLIAVFWAAKFHQNMCSSLTPTQFLGVELYAAVGSGMSKKH
jgi:hypothetical protein